MVADELQIVAYHRRHDRSTFNSGEPVVDDWLRLHASSSDRQHTTKTFLALEGENVVGYYASTMCQLDLQESVAVRNGARYPIPAIVLARLAVDINSQGKGIGRCLIGHALTGYAKVAEAVGFEVIVVHALNESASNYYRQFGFKPLPEGSNTLFLTVKDLLASMPKD